jgi:hypothetical protein
MDGTVKAVDRSSLANAAPHDYPRRKLKKYRRDLTWADPVVLLFLSHVKPTRPGPAGKTWGGTTEPT